MTTINASLHVVQLNAGTTVQTNTVTACESNAITMSVNKIGNSKFGPVVLDLGVRGTETFADRCRHRRRHGRRQGRRHGRRQGRRHGRRHASASVDMRVHRVWHLRAN